LDAPRHLDKKVHELYFNPENAFTNAFKELEPISQHKATGKLADFFAKV
jgi:hypothetical protein